MWLWIVATLAAFFVKGLCGFANTLVFTSITGFGISNVNISPIELVLGLPTNVILAWRNRKKLNKKLCVVLAVLLLAGSIPGALLLKNVNAQYIKILFGAVVILVSIEMFLRERNGKKRKGSPLLMGVIGLASGVLCGLFGIGILMAAYISRVTDSTSEFKANLSMVFIVDNIFRIILYAVLGVITLESLKMSFLLMPLMLLGLFAGMKSSQVLNEKIIKRLVIILLLIAGVMLILRSL